MTTVALDVEDLLHAAGDERWAGMPEGTVIGHVHLFVGDLEQAAVFYHVGLGLDKVVWSYPGALFLSAGGYHHHLGSNTWATGAAPAGAGDARLLEWEIVVPDTAEVQVVLASLERTGARGGAGRDGRDGARSVGDGAAGSAGASGVGAGRGPSRVRCRPASMLGRQCDKIGTASA